jgi:RimJ/RimL family protein N-acetyltransferase
MQLVLEGCTIRAWRLDDAESLAKRANNGKVWLALRDLFPHPQPAALAFASVRTCTGTRRSWVTGSVKAYGDAAPVAAAFTDFCFNNFPLRRVYAEPFVNTPASARVLMKAGFDFEGRLKTMS